MLDCLMASEHMLIFDFDPTIIEGVQDLSGSHHKKNQQLWPREVGDVCTHSLDSSYCLWSSTKLQKTVIWLLYCLMLVVIST